MSEGRLGPLVGTTFYWFHHIAQLLFYSAQAESVRIPNNLIGVPNDSCPTDFALVTL